MMKSYNELLRLKTFDERYEYLRLKSNIGEETFGYERYLNQYLYKSKRWLSVRDYVIIRDNGCDLGIDGLEIQDRIIVHHINPVTLEQIENDDPCLYDPDNLISTSIDTHNGIHFNKRLREDRIPIERHPNDTCPWKS